MFLKETHVSMQNIKLVILDNLKNYTESYANERWNKVKDLITHFMVRRAEFESA